MRKKPKTEVARDIIDELAASVVILSQHKSCKQRLPSTMLRFRARTTPCSTTCSRPWSDLSTKDNGRAWQFQKNERINCNFNLTVGKYDKDQKHLHLQSTRYRPTARYITRPIPPLLYNNVDENFTFKFAQFDQLDFNEETFDNQLTALFAYYAYLIIGIDSDTFSPMEARMSCNVA